MSKRRLVIMLLIVGTLALSAAGLFLPGKILPEISMAAERIPLPFWLPLFGDKIPNTLPATLAAMLILLGLGLAYEAGRRKAQSTGQRGYFVTAVEAIIEGMYSFVEGIAGKFTPVFFPWVATFFLFILTANWIGILPGVGSIGVWEEHGGEMILIPFFRSANADLSTTLALGLVSIAATQYFGFRFQGVTYLRKFFNFSAPKDAGKMRPLLVVANGFVGLLELVSDVIKIFSFAFRLFGNIFAGEVLLIVVSYLAAFIVSLPFMGLELFVGVIQALIFAMLSLIFFMMASHPHGEGEGHS